MLLSKVVGAVVSTEKAKKLVGQKLFLVEPFRLDPETRKKLIGTQRTLVAVDTVGAGVGQFVLVVQGSSARFTPETESLPVDATIIGLVNQITVGDQNVEM